jgi:hypothetical protein
MAYILKGDMILVEGKQAIATSDDYIRRVAGTGEYIDDWEYIPCIEYMRPETGMKGIASLRNVQKI